MPYLSQVLDKEVIDSSDQIVGHVRDILIKPVAQEYDPLMFLDVEEEKVKKHVYIPFSYVDNLSREETSLKTLFSKIPLGSPDSEFLYLKKDVLDQQIVDTAGARVVRVNDLRLSLVQEKMCVVGIDISFRGLSRRLGLERLPPFKWLKVGLLDWREAQPIAGTLKLEKGSHDLVKLHPADLANLVEDMSAHQGSHLVESLDKETAAKVFAETDPATRKRLIHILGPRRAAAIMEKMSVDELVDMLQHLPSHESEEFMELLQGGKLSSVKKLLYYDDDTAGGLMTDEFFSAPPEWTVEQLIDHLKRKSDAFSSILFVYVIDEWGIFKGVASLRRILVSNRASTLKTVMKKVTPSSVVHPHHKLRHIVKVMTKYNLYSIAVVENNKMVGVVTVDDVMRKLFPTA